MASVCVAMLTAISDWVCLSLSCRRRFFVIFELFLNLFSLMWVVYIHNQLNVNIEPNLSFSNFFSRPSRDLQTNEPFLVRLFFASFSQTPFAVFWLSTTSNNNDLKNILKACKLRDFRVVIVAWYTTPIRCTLCQQGLCCLKSVIDCHLFILIAQHTDVPLFAHCITERTI